MWSFALLAAAASASPNLLLVTIDTLRADHLRCYGDATIETPATDRLAREGVLLEEAVVQVPQTRPSHASILTGRYPYEHGVRDNFSLPPRADLPTLATLLKARGFETAAFIGGFPLTKDSGFNKGFDVYDDHMTNGPEGSGQALAERRASQVVDRALAWLGRPRTRRFFAWVHLYDPHAPYQPPAPYDRQYGKRPYDGEIAYADAQLGRLLAFLDRRGVARDTLVVVTSDHGEGLGEHGEDEHVLFVYDSTLRVPLLARWPAVLPAGRRITGQFRSVDIAPTVLELMRLPPVPMSGASRAKNLENGSPIPRNESYIESLYGQLHFGYAPLRGLRAEGLKYIDAPRAELYHLGDDPGELRNLLGQRAPLAEAMRKRLLGYGTGHKAAKLELPADEGSMERLIALGYIGAAGPAGAPAASGADPKDKIAEQQAYTRDVQKALRLFGAGNVDAALPILTRLSQQDSVSFEVQIMLGRCLLRKQRYAEAAKALQEAQRLLPKLAGPHVDLAQALRMQGRLEEARGVVNRGLEVAPANAALWEEGGLVLRGQGDLPAAQAALEKARTLDPKAVRARLALSAIQRQKGDVAGALAELREAVRLQPRFGDGWNALGVILAEQGKDEDAAQAFRSALEARPDDPDALFNLGDACLRLGRPAEAAKHLERLNALAPAFPGGPQALAAARALNGPMPEGCMQLSLLRVAERAQAEQIAARLATGEDFGALERSFSVGPSAARVGDLGVVCLSDLAEPIRDAARALAPGGVSAVLAVPPGYVVLRRER